MALRAVPPLNDYAEDDQRRERPVLSSCPICGGNMEVVYQRNNQQVVVCVDCQSGITVPATAWEIVRIKRQATWMPKP
jgi:hypothetical protein